MGWKNAIDQSLPVWEDYSSRLDRFDELVFPSPELLSEQLAGKLITKSAQPLCFVDSNELVADVGYEQQIFRTGRVSTRQDSFHDLFNALVWSRFPRLKAAMNAAHCSEIDAGSARVRGKRRDALTLFDECGIVILSANAQFLGQLARHNWRVVFQENRQDWEKEISVFVAGHALLEKYLHPYKAITAQALLIHSDASAASSSRESLLCELDQVLATAVSRGTLLATTRCLSPVPVAGIPGWWPADEIGDEFYSDADVFRTRRANRPIAPIFASQALGFRVPVD